jgi:hypothetical protein
MAKKKTAKKKKAAKKLIARKKSAAKKKPAPKKKIIARKKIAAKKKPARRKVPARAQKSEIANPVTPRRGRGLGPGAGGQSGDLQGLSRKALGDSESVEELIEDGQDFEAEAVSGVENALDPDQGEVTTKEVLEDDVPTEYDDQK